MDSLHSNQKRLMERLLELPEGATLDELSEYLGLSKTATKGHILRLESHGYLTFEDVHGSVGRPRRHYRLSQQGQEVFPRQYSWLSNILLELLTENLGNAKVGTLMNQLADKVAHSMKDRFSDANSSAELMKRINEVMNELGYRTSLKQSDLRKGAVLEATNCVYHSVAKTNPRLCQFDVRFLQNVSGMNVQLESCIARGSSVCRFCIRKR